MKQLRKLGLKCLFAIIVILPISINSQEKKEFKPKVKWNVTTQFWLRYSDLNEGSLVNGEPTKSFTDISIRS